MRKVNPSDSPILFLALSSPTLPLQQVDEYAETMLAQRLSSLPGVAQVNVFGSQKFAVRIKLNPDALAARGIGLDEIQAAAQAGNVNLATGSLEGIKTAQNIRADGQIFDAATFRQQIVAYRNGAPVRLGDIGTIVDSVENDKVASWYNNDARHRAGHPAPAGVEHHRGGGRASAGCCRASRRCCRRPSTSTSSTTAANRSAPRSPMCSSA